MPDDPKKKGADAKRVSQQPHEQKYQKQKAKKAAAKNPANNRCLARVIEIRLVVPLPRECARA
jgi:hypothetical protein